MLANDVTLEFSLKKIIGCHHNFLFFKTKISPKKEFKTKNLKKTNVYNQIWLNLLRDDCHFLHIFFLWKKFDDSLKNL